MLFNSLQFAVFFPAAALICFVIPKKLRCLWLLLASYVFYMSANPKYAVLLLFTTVVTYAGGLLLGRVPENRKKAVLALVFAACLAVLALFKYFDFLLGNLNTALGARGSARYQAPSVLRSLWVYPFILFRPLAIWWMYTGAIRNRSGISCDMVCLCRFFR